LNVDLTIHPSFARCLLLNSYKQDIVDVQAAIKASLILVCHDSSNTVMKQKCLKTF